MTSTYVTITPHDPIIARDGRPFGAGQGIRMRSLEWPYPSVLAGSLRTLLGKLSGTGFDAATVEMLKLISIAGPLASFEDQLYFPSPKDILIRDENGKRDTFALRPMPMRPDEGWNLPAGLWPTTLPDSVEKEFKPAKIPAIWSIDKMVEWLADPTGFSFVAPKDPDKLVVGDGFFDSLKKEVRVHVKIFPETGASEDRMLFETAGLDLSRKGRSSGLKLAARIDSVRNFGNVVNRLHELHPFGGERRLAEWKVDITQNGWACPKKITDALRVSRRIRMVLATPAIFDDGWKPGWLKQGIPPGAPENVKLGLVSGCLGRWKPISGYSLENAIVGPKEVRRLVPGGSVYFFNVLKGEAKELAEKLWLRPVSDGEQDRRDGFGLALWGAWDSLSESTQEQKKEV